MEPGHFRGERVLLRPARDGDVPALMAVLRDPEVAPWWGDYDEGRLRADMNDPGAEMFVVEIEGGVIGLLQVVEENEPDYRHAALDISLRSDRHHQGLGQETLRVAIDYLIDERGHHRFTIDPAAENDRAIRCYTAVGFRPVGVMRRYERAPDGRWRDSLLMDLLAEEYRAG